MNLITFPNTQVLWSDGPSVAKTTPALRAQIVYSCLGGEIRLNSTAEAPGMDLQNRSAEPFSAGVLTMSQMSLCPYFVKHHLSHGISPFLEATHAFGGVVEKSKVYGQAFLSRSSACHLDLDSMSCSFAPDRRSQACQGPCNGTGNPSERPRSRGVARDAGGGRELLGAARTSTSYSSN